MIDNVKSARVKRAASLSRKKDRAALQQFLVEGPNAVRELLMHAPGDVREVFMTTSQESWHIELERIADAQGVQLTYVTEQVLAAIAETVHPQGVVAVAAMRHTDLGEALSSARLVAVLHEIRDPGNAGTVLRVADAAGADLVIFSGDSVDPWHPKVVRATTGSLFHVPVSVHHSLAEVVNTLREAGLRVLAADVRGEPLSVDNGNLALPTAWLFGNEARGLSASDRELADASVQLPIYGKAESLNLATAASVLMYQSAFAQNARGTTRLH